MHELTQRLRHVFRHVCPHFHYVPLYGSLWGMACDDAGACVESRMQTPEGYTLTALASLVIVEKVLAGDAPVGYQTPASAYGADWVLAVEGVTRVDVARPL